MPFLLTVQIELVNDNVPVLMLDGANMEINYNVTYFERQPYLPTNPTQIALSNGLSIIDADAGESTLVEANITILNGKGEGSKMTVAVFFSLSRCCV